MASELTAPESRVLECHAASGVFVIAHGAPSGAVRALAAHLAADDDHARVIVDLPADLPTEPPGQQAGQPASLLRDVLPVLAADPRPLRLIPSNQGLAATTGIGRLIADALGRTILAHHGSAIAASSGGLFVPPASGPGWVRVRPGGPSNHEPGAPRFPAPRWTVLAPLDQPTMLSQATMAEPLPGGAWLHEPRADGSLGQFALWLTANLAWSDDHVYIVLGHPGAPAPPAADLARFLETLPVKARGLVRLVPFGGTSQADLPLPDTDKVQPPNPERSSLTPQTPPIVPPSIALESGPAEMAGPSAEFTAAAGQASGGSLDLPSSPDGTVREGGEAPRTVRDNGVAGVSKGVRVQPVPGSAASLAAPARGLAQERQWVRRALAADFDASASAVARVLSQTPGLRAPREQAADALVDLVAARLYLSGRGQGIDDAARTGGVGPHVPFGRCAAAGLARLPSYRGPARLCAALGDAEWRWYGARTLVTDWAFCLALTDGDAGAPGGVDFLIWSVTARRADLLAPGGGGHVIFLPGTSFRVLRVRSGQRREVLLRELAPGEVGEDGQVDVIAAFDDVAVAGLEKASAAWLGAGAGAGAGAAAGDARRFCTPPGLVLADASVVESAAGAASGSEVSGAHA